MHPDRFSEEHAARAHTLRADALPVLEPRDEELDAVGRDCRLPRRAPFRHHEGGRVEDFAVLGDPRREDRVVGRPDDEVGTRRVRHGRFDGRAGEARSADAEREPLRERARGIAERPEDSRCDPVSIVAPDDEPRGRAGRDRRVLLVDGGVRELRGGQRARGTDDRIEHRGVRAPIEHVRSDGEHDLVAVEVRRHGGSVTLGVDPDRVAVEQILVVLGAEHEPVFAAPEVVYALDRNSDFQGRSRRSCFDLPRLFETPRMLREDPDGPTEVDLDPILRS